MSASDVAEYISGQKSSGQPELFQPELYKSKSSHLAEISRAPVQSWIPLVLLLVDKEIYLELHPETRHGGDRKSADKNQNDTMSFCSDTSKKTGKSKRTTERNSAASIR